MIHEYIIKVDESKPDIMGGVPLTEPAKELIRCKDCKYSRKTVIPYLRSEQKWCNRQETHHPFDWYCADGEAKE